MNSCPFMVRCAEQLEAALRPLVRAGAKFENGVLVQRPDESTSGDTHAA
jgi:hypothetical protein